MISNYYDPVPAPSLCCMKDKADPLKFSNVALKWIRSCSQPPGVHFFTSSLRVKGQMMVMWQELM